MSNGMNNHEQFQFHNGVIGRRITDSQFTTECPRCGWTGKMSSRNQVTISARGHLCPTGAEMRQGVV